MEVIIFLIVSALFYQLIRFFDKKYNLKKVDKLLNESRKVKLIPRLDGQLGYSRTPLDFFKKEEINKWSCETYVHAIVCDRKYLKEAVEEYFKEEIKKYLTYDDSDYYRRCVELESKLNLTEFILHHILGRNTSRVVILKVFENFKNKFHKLESQGNMNIYINGIGFYLQLNGNAFVIKLNNEIILHFKFIEKKTAYQSCLRYEVDEILLFRIGPWLVDFLDYNRELLISNVKEIEVKESLNIELHKIKKIEREQRFKPIF